MTNDSEDAAPDSVTVVDNVPAQSAPEPFRSMKEAARFLNLPYWKIQRAVKDNLIPHYSLLDDKKFVRLSEIIAVMKTSSNENTNA